MTRPDHPSGRVSLWRSLFNKNQEGFNKSREVAAADVAATDKLGVLGILATPFVVFL
jgi:hypothetical protein